MRGDDKDAQRSYSVLHGPTLAGPRDGPDGPWSFDKKTEKDWEKTANISRQPSVVER